MRKLQTDSGAVGSSGQHGWWYTQLFTNWKPFEIFYTICLVLLQFAAYLWIPSSLMGIASGVFGVLCLVYGMKNRNVTFVFGVLQYIAMGYIALTTHAYGSFAIDIFYVLSQPVGWYFWIINHKIRYFSSAMRGVIAGISVVAWIAGWVVLAHLHGQLPYLDSINFVVSFIAQVLFIFKFQENWALWIVVNGAGSIYSTILALRTFNGQTGLGSLGDNVSQVALQFALLFNAVYAYYQWSKGPDGEPRVK